MEPIRTRKLEVTVISCENLYVDQSPVTENAYVVVRPDSIRCWSTKMAKGSTGYLTWNEKLLVEMPLHAKSITFEVQCKTSKGMLKSVGIARMAISEVIGEESGEVLSYRLRNWEGRRSGVINFSVKEKNESEENEEEEEEEGKGMMVNSGGFNIKPEIMGGQLNHGHEMNGSNNNNGVVIGVPVWWNHLGIHVKI